jgi:hypothetical protein
MEAATLDRGELYERLLTGFAEREVRRTEPSLSADDLDRAIGHELTRLSVVALAMFNRRRQWVTQSELDMDLPALLGSLCDHRSPAELRARLTAGQIMIGRFYFVYEAQATRDGTRLSTYEFARDVRRVPRGALGGPGTVRASRGRRGERPA